ncbi:T9SS type A sorting domain-containing protein [Salinibacter altiplanensis]|uniref:T9SS type A sorting domain-containing protein n=1 Tax=Salinibacter altiplanensis TaxID=1803181 RepID=UPI001E4EFA0D|nr:T9SS type A sorting domain-containing protein [Salinibacter altiplanensis]
MTRAFGEYVRFQDESDNSDPSGLTVGPVSGALKDDIGGDITKGTRLYVRGTLSEPDGLLRIDNSGLKNYIILEQGSLPMAQDVSLSTLRSSGDKFESELLRVDGLSFPNASGTFAENTTYEVEEGTTLLDYQVGGAEETNLGGKSIPAGTFTYEGVLGASRNGPQLVPIRASTALPVDLTGFSAVRNGSSVLLTWQTANETNNAGFRVQYDQTGSWQTLDFVPSNAADGSTGEAQSYRFTVDRRLGPGTHRFRLEQVDLDETTALSDTVQIAVGMEGALHLSAPAPNPVSERATFSFAVQEGAEAEVVLYNMLGQQVKTLYEGTPRAGQSTPLRFDAGGLSSGAYVVQLRADGRTRTRRLTIVR